MSQKKIVMLVDDNDTDNFIHRRLLELTGFCEEIIVKNSGKLALEYLESLIPTPEKIPELIFLDINMPVVDGFVFLFEFGTFPDEIRERAKVVILTSSDNKKDIDRIIDNDFVIHFITKPLSESALEELNKIL